MSNNNIDSVVKQIDNTMVTQPELESPLPINNNKTNDNSNVNNAKMYTEEEVEKLVDRAVTRGVQTTQENMRKKAEEKAKKEAQLELDAKKSDLQKEMESTFDSKFRELNEKLEQAEINNKLKDNHAILTSRFNNLLTGQANIDNKIYSMLNSTDDEVFANNIGTFDVFLNNLRESISKNVKTSEMNKYNTIKTDNSNRNNTIAGNTVEIDLQSRYDQVKGLSDDHSNMKKMQLFRQAIDNGVTLKN